MAFHDINLLANTLSPQEFELLLREYIAKQLSDNAIKVDYISLFYFTYKNEAKWTITQGDTRTAGELLSMCAVEACRREAADKANTLLLLEHNN